MHRSVHRRSERSPEAGLTILEVLIASAILLVVVSGVLTTTYSGLRLQATSRERSTATYWAEHLMEQARNQAYDSIGLTDTSAAIAAAMAGVPAGDTDNPDLRLRQSAAGNCLEFNTGTSGSPAWERLVLADWHSSPASAASCSLEAVDPGFHLDHAGGDNDYVAAGTPVVTYRGWVFVTWAAVQGTSTWYKRVTVVVRYPSPTGGLSRLVQTSSTFSLGYVPARPAATTTTTTSPTTTTVPPTTTSTTLPVCPPKAGDSQAPTGSIALGGGAGYTNQPTVDVNNSVTDPVGGSGMATMALSNVGASGPFLPVPPAAYGAVYSGWPLLAGDGAKTVWGRFADCNGNATVLSGAIPGSLISETGVIRQFNAGNKASCPSTAGGEAVDTTNDVHGDVLAGGGTLACKPAPAGAVDAAASGFNLNGATVGGRACNDPPPYTMPDYTFQPRNYSPIQYYGMPPGYGSASATAVADFNTALSTGTLPTTTGALDRAYVVWQDLTAYQALGTTPPALELDATTLPIAANTLVYTNVPIDFGTTTKVTAAAACSTTGGTPACPTFVVVSTYPGSPCSGGVGNCPSIFGGNQIEFRPEVAVVLFAHDGTIELKNDCSSANCSQSNQGAVYGKTVDAKNNLDISYSPRIADALGFGTVSLLQRSYQELPPCPAGQATC